MPKTVQDIAKTMRDIDFAMLSTRAEDGSIASRPMSNNREVDWTGDSWFFTTDDTRTIDDIGRDPKVGLAYQGRRGMVGQRPLFIAVEGRADLVRDKAAFRERWTTDLDRWFKDGIDTPGLVLIRVAAGRVHYWDGEDEGEVPLGR